MASPGTGAAGAGAGAGAASEAGAPTVSFIDIGANLTDDMFQGIYRGSRKHDADLPDVLQRAWSAGVARIMITGTSLAESRAALAVRGTSTMPSQ